MHRIALFAVPLVGMVIAGVLAWNGWRTGRVIVAGGFPRASRETRPMLYWIAMGVYVLVALGGLGVIMALAFGLIRISN